MMEGLTTIRQVSDPFLGYESCRDFSLDVVATRQSEAYDSQR